MANTPTSKVIFGTETLIDLTGDTAEPGDVLLGKSFHRNSGAPATGTLDPVKKPDVAVIEPSSTASAPHLKDTYLYYDGTLYKATDDIAQDDTIITSGASANVEEVTVGGELASQNTSLANKAAKNDLTNISITGSTNTTGSTIIAGTYFYKDGALVRAKVDIANGATLTVNTNYEAVTAGGLNELINDLNTTTSISTNDIVDLTSLTSGVTLGYITLARIKNTAIGHLTAYFSTTVNSGNSGLDLGTLKKAFFTGGRPTLPLIDDTDPTKIGSVYINSSATGIRCYGCVANHAYYIDALVFINTSVL